ncbi:hypothetical protein niasHT_007864 [Heterodera trifolii]|uniref:Apoptosis-antagonizing transcription factor C-terminal domain-containing protein n=1 Tax=Heterodera trifolii TaxID=157864 RepID=A0ABD2LZA6_9BILA
MSDRLALWDRLMVLASKNTDDMTQQPSEEQRQRIYQTDEAKSALLHLLLTDCLAKNDETTVCDRFKMLKEENNCKIVPEMFSNLPLGRLLVNLEGNDNETRTRVEEVRNLLFRALQLLIDAEITPSDELLGSFEQQKMYEEAKLSGLSTLQWLERQRSLNKRGKKRKQEVDTKASKGRKIRYVEIPKLVNFFPATPERIAWTHERRDELFRSLFI